MKKYLCSIPGAIGALSVLGTSALFAEEAATSVEIPSIINPNGLQANFVTAVTPWLVVGLSLAIGIFVVFVGWRALRKGAKSGISG